MHYPKTPLLHTLLYIMLSFPLHLGKYITNRYDQNKLFTLGINGYIGILDLSIKTSITELTCSSLRPLQNLRHTSTSGLSHHKHVALRPSFCVATNANANGDSANYSIKRLKIHTKHNHQKSHFQNETYIGKKNMIYPQMKPSTCMMLVLCTLS